jgi:hypothetical protein
MKKKHKGTSEKTCYAYKPTFDAIDEKYLFLFRTAGETTLASQKYCGKNFI